MANEFTPPVKEIRADTEEVERYLSDFPEETFEQARAIFLEKIAKAHTRVQANLRLRMKVRTGNLSRATRFSVTGTNLRTLDAHLYVAHQQSGEEMVYAKTHEYGSPPGGIVAKNAYKNVPGGPYLNIPAKPNLTPAGVMRKGPRTVFEEGGFIVQAASGRWVVMDREGTLMFSLVKKVHIPPRMGMRKAMDDQTPHLLKDLQEIIGTEG
jgi:hypothetical protein